MANIFENRVLETSVSTGVGTMVLDGAVASYRRFAAALAIGSTCHYLIQAVDPLGRPSGQYEYGRGTYSAANALARTTVLGSSNADALVDFAVGPKQVALSALAPSTEQLRQDWRNALGTGTISYRNLLLNGRFVVNQDSRTGVVVLAAGKYGHDGWKAGPAGCTYSFAKVNNLTVLTITSGTLQQVVHGRLIDGGSYVMTWGGTAQGRIGASAYASKFAAATGVAAGANVTVEFGTGTLSSVQFESGTSASLYDNVFPILDLIRCRDYYRTSYVSSEPGTAGAVEGRKTALASSTSAYAAFDISFDPPMWMTPAVTFYNPATGTAGQMRNETTGADYGVTGVGSGSISPNGTSVQATVAPGPSNTMSIHYTADARL